jgi:hypothetical protein
VRFVDAIQRSAIGEIAFVAWLEIIVVLCYTFSTGGTVKMSDTKVKEEEVLSALRSLEPERWFEVLDFIGYLKHRTTEVSETPRIHPLTARELLSSELVGIWADRDENELRPGRYSALSHPGL